MINKNSKGKYSFNNVVNSSMTAKDPNNPTPKELNELTLTLDKSSVATIHTHWRPNGNLNFSNPQDYLMPKEIQNIYLVNREGNIYYSSRSTKKGNINGFSLGKKIFSIK